jgi:hypothetical protein
MFVSIREEDIRRNCPEYAPMTLQVLNKLYPVEEDTFETTGRLKQLPRMVYAPSSIHQLSEQITRLNLSPSATDIEVRVGEKMVEKQILEKVGLDETMDLLSQLPDVPQEENLDNIRAANSYMDNLFSRTFREVTPIEDEEFVEITEPDMVVVDEIPRDVSERPPRADKGVLRGPQKRTIEKKMMGAEDFDAPVHYDTLPLPGLGY